MPSTQLGSESLIRPLVSILIPAYNAERWIGETIQSALNQTWPRKELIVIDDGSTDDTFAIARQFGKYNIKIIRQDNTGACTTRNILFSLAQGDYIQWLDADDILAPDKIEKQMKWREGGGASDVLLTSACASFFFQPRRGTWHRTGLWQDLCPTDWIVTKFVEGAWMNPTTWLVSRRLATAAGPWDARLARSGDDDGEFLLRVVAAAKEVRFVPDALCFYRIGVSGSLNWNLGVDRERLEALLLSLQLSTKHLLDLEDSSRTRRACLNYLKMWSHEFYGIFEPFQDRLNALAQEVGGSIDEPVAPWKYRAIERSLGPIATAGLMREWRRYKLRVAGKLDLLLWKLAGERLGSRLPAGTD